MFAASFSAQDTSFINGRFAVLKPCEIAHGCVDLLSQFAIELVETLVALAQLRWDLLPRHRVNRAS
ncbi:hypothetical protein D3C74_463780 [compost metagenome]